MNKIIRGNILDIQEGIIAHQVNCQRVAGAGLALQIRNKWPDWYAEFLKQEPHLGCVFYYAATQKEHPERKKFSTSIFIASLYTQDRYGTKKRYTDYIHLGNALAQIAPYVSEICPLYIPYGIGCGLGGGDWAIVSNIIEIIVPNATLVKL